MVDFREVRPDGLSDLPDDRLVRVAIGELWELSAFCGDLAAFRRQIDALTPGQRAVFGSAELDAAVQGRGFRAFLDELFGMTRAEVLDGLELLGMDEAARILRASAEGPDEAALQALYAGWFEERKAFTARQAALIRARPDDFFTDV